MVYIYILKLENDKYYVGKTTNPDIRINSHLNSNGSLWTIKYKPLLIHQIIPDCDDYDEDKYTRIYMDKYGINNVRGGSYVQINLEKTTIEELEKMKNGTNDNCFICGEKGHFSKNCVKPIIINSNKFEKIIIDSLCKCVTSYIFPHKKSKCILENMTIFKNPNIETKKKLKEELEEELTKKLKEELTEKIIKSHKNEIHKCNYCEKQFTTLKGKTYHENIYCKNNVNLENSDIKSVIIKETIMHECNYCKKKFTSLNGKKYHEDMYCTTKLS
jgi:hypothetical protein